MKTAQLLPLRAACLLAVLAFATLGTPAQAGPAISAKQAVQLAEEALAQKNAGDGVYIESVVLQHTSVFSGKAIWTVTWSAVLPGSQPGSHEVGLEIGMDGTVTHLVKGRGKVQKPQIPHEIGH